MKKKFLLALFTAIILGGAKVKAQTVVSVPLQVAHFDPTSSQTSHGRTPMSVPSVTLDDHTLYTIDVWFNATLQLVDEDGEVVYTTFVPQGTPSVALPDSLSGDYELQILWGNWCFYGWINL